VVDQSTLSRDLAELGARKSGGRYVLLNGHAEGVAELNVAAAVQRFTTCGPNLIVLFTGVGQAQLVAVAVEEQQDPSIVGTVGGDDTIFIATRNQRAQSVALRRLVQWFGDKHER
jgi:transcriptional regulator of arginine metabolism